MNVFTITLGFVPTRIWKQSAEAYAATRNHELPYQHFFVDQHYPLNKSENREGNRAVCAEHGIAVLDPGRNLGLHEGFNWALQQINPPPNSVVIAYDPDVNPISPGWDMALVRAIRGDSAKKVVWSSLLHAAAREELKRLGTDRRFADGYIEMLIARGPVMNSICAWSVDWLKSVGLLSEPRAFYGHLEAAMWDRLNGKQWAFLPGWTEDETFRRQQDHEYMMYKWVHAHLQTWDGDFESWLAAGQPMPEKT